MSLLQHVHANTQRLLRAVHLYLGLFISPFVLVFAVSAILLNHTYKPGGESSKATIGHQAGIEIPEDLEGLPLAKHIMHQVDVSGEIEFLRHQPQQKRLVIPVMRPGQRITITVELERKTAEIEQRRAGFWDAMLYLHKSPGPHLAGFRGNWLFTQIWTWLADATACLLLFLSASGIYLWAVLKAQHKAGLILIGAGGLSFFALLFALVH